MGICTDDCDCILEAEDGLEVNGIGTAGDPYVIGVAATHRLLTAAEYTRFGTGDACGLLHSTPTSIADVTPTTISFDTEGFDTAGMHSTVTNVARITIQNDGYYYLSAGVRFTSNAVGGRFIHIKRTSTGPATAYVASQGFLAANGLETYASVDCLTRAVAGDFFFVEVYQNSGVALNVEVFEESSPRFSAIMLRGL